jgi:hypothetical protein
LRHWPARDLTADVLYDKTTPLLDAINLRLALSDYDCTLGKSASNENATIANDVDLLTLTVDGKVITGGYGGRRKYPDYILQGCGNDPSLRPTWVLDEDMYQSKKHCCSKNFMPGQELLGDKFPYSAAHIVPVHGAEHDAEQDAKQDAKREMPKPFTPPPPLLPLPVWIPS